MPPVVMKKRLEGEAKLLSAELAKLKQTFQWPLKTPPVSVVTSDKNAAYYATVVSGNPRLSVPQFLLWLDNYTTAERFYFGFCTSSKNSMNNFLRLLPMGDLQPAKAFATKDWTNSGWKNPNDPALRRVFREDYSSHSWYGMYDWGGHASKSGNRLDTQKTLQFVRSVLEYAFPARLPRTEDDPEYRRAIKVRLGQPKFRNALLAAYKSRCAVSGCDVIQLLEAAHVRPYSNYGEYSIKNGILLRSDLHTLFDRGLLKISPKTRKVVLHRSITDQQYRRFHGRQIIEPAKVDDRIDSTNLSARWAKTIWTEV